jgi:hypothetical protein
MTQQRQADGAEPDGEPMPKKRMRDGEPEEDWARAERLREERAKRSIGELVINVDPKAKLPKRFDLWSMELQLAWLRQHQKKDAKLWSKNIDRIVQRSQDKTDGVLKRKPRVILYWHKRNEITRSISLSGHGIHLENLVQTLAKAPGVTRVTSRIMDKGERCK